ncbi:MAG: TIM barrel protein [Pseudomonadales bacterium]
MAPISVQLYSLRTESERDFNGVLQALAATGYQGVEPFNLYGFSPRQFRERVEALGMRISSSHYPFANRVPVQQTVDTLGELGLTRAVGGYAPADFADLDTVRRVAEATNRLVDDLAAANITLALHNHWWEFAEFEGTCAYHLFQDLVPGVAFELDTYWAANFGAREPAAELARIRSRTPLLHLKDGPLTKGEPMVALGDGRQDIAAILAAADPDVLEWAIVELDACATDMLTAIQDSYTYLIRNQLAGTND